MSDTESTATSTPTDQGAAGADAAAEPITILGGKEQAPADKPDETKTDDAKTDPAAEAKDAGGDDKADGEGEKDGDKPAGAPDVYDPFDLPEGAVVSEEGIKEFSDLAKELNLSQENAQRLVSLQTKVMEEGAAKLAEAFDKQVDTWAEAARNDPEIGGDKHNQAVEDAKIAIKKLGGDPLAKVLDSSGLGSHPTIIRFMAKVGAIVKDDTVIPGGAPAGERSPKTMYPNSDMR